jgi:hypothetical protein
MHRCKTPSLASSSGSAALRVSRLRRPIWLCPLVLCQVLLACGDDGDSPADGNAGSAGSSVGGASGSPASAGTGGTSAVTGGTGGTPATPAGDGGVGECNASVVESPPTSALHLTQCSAIDYSTNPPSGGDHYAIWAAYQTYDFPLPAGYLVHALEHGAVVFWYNCPEGCADEVAEVEAFIDGLPEDPRCVTSGVPRRTVLVPSPTLASRWAASAWGFALTADCFDSEAFRAFYDEHYGLAPEDLCGASTPITSNPCL